MEELQRIATYSDFKQELDKTFTGISEGFVRAGYLLKQARDTDILRESGYKSVTEFAAAEYGLTETYVSRFIAINDRYSEGGYSDCLQERYRGYGMSKLAEMLTLPEQLADAIPPELSREEIREVKREVAEENKITDLEVILEGQQDTELLLPARAMKQYFYDNPEKYMETMRELAKNEPAGQEKQKEVVLDILAPSGAAVLMVRVQGVGKLMISIQGLERDMEIQNVRTLEREIVTWSSLMDEIFQVYGREALTNPEIVWERVYGEPFPEQEQPEAAVKSEKKEKIAPAQAGKPEPITKKGEEDGTEEESETCCDVATESQGTIVNTEAELDPETTEHCQECRFAHPESQAKRLAYASVCEECEDGSNFQMEKAPEGQQEPEEVGKPMASELERQLRRQIIDLAEEIRMRIKTVTTAPIEIGTARTVHAAARKLLSLADRIMDIKESEQEELEGQLSIEDWENDS